MIVDQNGSSGSEEAVELSVKLGGTARMTEFVPPSARSETTRSKPAGRGPGPVVLFPEYSEG